MEQYRGVGLAVALLTFAASRMRLIRGVVMLLGGWLLLSPFVLGFSKAIVSWNNIFMGTLIIVGTVFVKTMRSINISPVPPNRYNHPCDEFKPTLYFELSVECTAISGLIRRWAENQPSPRL